ncbi:hypothetical protein [Polyangium spumosum]|uniref:Uncharacterized protein n=1 Tax=Polyangium spumosum TaxID=889282 RepID=A0A6N7PYR2_9BACT|nr:hypothetical protein [Polyangium spumosum]MRG96006.1 hypothetical protein [Polyangium spumosum]
MTHGLDDLDVAVHELGGAVVEGAVPQLVRRVGRRALLVLRVGDFAESALDVLAGDALGVLRQERIDEGLLVERVLRRDGLECGCEDAHATRVRQLGRESRHDGRGVDLARLGRELPREGVEASASRKLVDGLLEVVPGVSLTPVGDDVPHLRCPEVVDVPVLLEVDGRRGALPAKVVDAMTALHDEGDAVLAKHVLEVDPALDFLDAFPEPRIGGEPLGLLGGRRGNALEDRIHIEGIARDELVEEVSRRGDARDEPQPRDVLAGRVDDVVRVHELVQSPMDQTVEFLGVHAAGEGENDAESRHVGGVGVRGDEEALDAIPAGERRLHARTAFLGEETLLADSTAAVVQLARLDELVLIVLDDEQVRTGGVALVPGSREMPGAPPGEVVLRLRGGLGPLEELRHLLEGHRGRHRPGGRLLRQTHGEANEPRFRGLGSITHSDILDILRFRCRFNRHREALLSWENTRTRPARRVFAFQGVEVTCAARWAS